MNTLYYGDNLDILRNRISDESVDTIYLDPPINTARNEEMDFGSRISDAVRSIGKGRRMHRPSNSSFHGIIRHHRRNHHLFQCTIFEL